MIRMKRNIWLYILVVIGAGKTGMAAEPLASLQWLAVNETGILLIAIIAGGLALAILWFFIIRPILQSRQLGSSSSTHIDNIDEFEPDFHSVSHEKNKTKKLDEILQLLPSHAMKLNNISERLKALESAAIGKKDNEWEQKLVRLEEGLKFLKDSYEKQLGMVPAVSAFSRSLPPDMNYDHAGMVAVVNKWWGMAERSRGQLLEWCRQLGIDASFAKITNTQALKDAPLPPYEIEAGQTDSGGWLFCSTEDINSAYILPVDLNYFSDSVGNPILVDMFGEAKPVFEYVFRACELEDLQGGKFKVRNRGILQQTGKKTPSIEPPLTFDEMVALKSQGKPTRTVWEELNNLKKDIEQMNKSLRNFEKNYIQKPTSTTSIDTQQFAEEAIKKVLPRLQTLENKLTSELNRLQLEMNRQSDKLTEQLNILLEKELKEHIIKEIDSHLELSSVKEKKIPSESAESLEVQDVSEMHKMSSSISIPPDGWVGVLYNAMQNLAPESGLLERLIRLQQGFENYASKHRFQANIVHLCKIKGGQFELHPATLENQQKILSCPGCATKVREKESLLVQFFIQLGDPRSSNSWLFLPVGIEFTSDDFPSGYQLLVEGDHRGKITAIKRPAVLEQIVGPKNTYRVKTKMQLELEKKTIK
jgi:hypothetical protein